MYTFSVSAHSRVPIRGTFLYLGWALLCSLFAGSALAQAPAKDVCVNGACFSPNVRIADQNISLRGTGLFRYMFFDIYSGAFYAPVAANNIKTALTAVPKRLELHYHRSLSRENFIESSEEMLSDNPEVEVSEIRTELDMLYRLYTDVEKGDRYALEYIPGQGTALYLNGSLQGRIPGEKFQAAYFSIWISRYSVSDAFTEALLGE